MPIPTTTKIPTRYEIKHWLAYDNKARYVWNMQQYICKNPGEDAEKNQIMRVVFDLK